MSELLNNVVFWQCVFGWALLVFVWLLVECWREEDRLERLESFWEKSYPEWTYEHQDLMRTRAHLFGEMRWDDVH